MSELKQAINHIYNMMPDDDEEAEFLSVALKAMQEKLERENGCPYCDIAKANENIRNTALWVKEAQTSKWTMMGKELIYCPMCGRKLKGSDQHE